MDEHSRIAKLEAQVDAIKEDVAELKTDVRDLHSRITTGNREIMDKIDNKFETLSRSETAAHEDLKSIWPINQPATMAAPTIM